MLDLDSEDKTILPFFITVYRGMVNACKKDFLGTK